MVLHLIKNFEFGSKFMRMSNRLSFFISSGYIRFLNTSFPFSSSGIQVQCLI